MDYLKSVKKALVPLVLAGVVVALEAIGVDLPVEQDEQIATGIVTSVIVWATRNR